MIVSLRVISIAMKMNALISDRGGVIGTTESGKGWSLKALHPADPIAQFTGIPDEDAYVTVPQVYNFTYAVDNPTPLTAGTWGFDLFCFANPLIPASLHTHASDGTHSWATIVNPQVGGSGEPYINRLATFMSQVEQYRLGYMGVTGHLDAAAVTDQGMIGVTQYPMTNLFLTYSLFPAPPTEKNVKGKGPDSDSALRDVFPKGELTRRVEVYNTMPKSWTELQTMPNAYQGTSRAGFYAPYKLSETCQKWRNAHDIHAHVPYGNSLVGVLPMGAGDWSIPVYATGPATSDRVSHFPYGMPGLAVSSLMEDAAVLQRADVGCMQITGRNLHQSSSYSCMFRTGYELRVSAGSPMTTFAKLSPVYDPLALQGYFAISREMRDAYPEEYNTFGALLGTIANAAATALPTILPMLGKAWSAIKAGFAGRPMDSTAQKVERAVETAPAAAKQRVVEAYQAATAAPSRRAARTARKNQRNRINDKLLSQGRDVLSPRDIQLMPLYARDARRQRRKLQISRR